MVDFSKVGIHGAVLIDLDCYGDSRGFFLETYQRERYEQSGLDVEFVQDNRSRSSKNVLRGLHYQIVHPQGHLVYVTSGTVFDVGLDLRKNSPTFKHWVGVTLCAEKQQQLYLPPGVAHGFCALTDGVEIIITPKRRGGCFGMIQTLGSIGRLKILWLKRAMLASFA